MSTYCGADSGRCPHKANCRGCRDTGGSPFGGRCVAAEIVQAGGPEDYREFKRRLLEEINVLLAGEGLGRMETLFELVGAMVNLAYPTPGGEKVKLLNDKNIYLGAQLEVPGTDFCCGVVADETFLLLCRYKANGTEPELIAFRKRRGAAGSGPESREND